VAKERKPGGKQKENKKRKQQNQKKPASQAPKLFTRRIPQGPGCCLRFNPPNYRTTSIQHEIFKANKGRSMSTGLH
jgi:hypothetical protein